MGLKDFFIRLDHSPADQRNVLGMVCLALATLCLFLIIDLRDTRAEVRSLRDQRDAYVIDYERGNNGFGIAEAEALRWDLFIDAVAWVESGWNPFAVGDKDDAGWLQITPRALEDANRIIGYERWRAEDRFDPDESVAIFNTVQDCYNPQHDRHLALKIWNPRAPYIYHTKVFAKYAELLTEQNLKNF